MKKRKNQYKVRTEKIQALEAENRKLRMLFVDAIKSKKPIGTDLQLRFYEITHETK